jgi:hypothetical protein
MSSRFAATSKTFISRTFRVRIENLEVELHRFHVEWNVLLGLPPHQLARLLLLDALDLNFLNDDVAPTDTRHDRRRLHAGRGERRLDRVGDDAGIHHLALDDRVGEQRSDGNPHELGLALRMVDDGDLDQAGADIETNGCSLSTQKSHLELARSAD